MTKFLRMLGGVGALVGLVSLSACNTPVEDLKPTTFGQNQLNRASTGRIVQIVSLMPAKATVANTNNSSVATGTGAAVGGGLGAGLGSAFGGTAAGVGAGLGGALIGGLIGNAVIPPELHPQALIIAYQDPNVPQIQNTIEIAKPCEFKPGTAYAVEIDGETKIQPNNFQQCQIDAQNLKK